MVWRNLLIEVATPISETFLKIWSKWLELAKGKEDLDCEYKIIT